MPRATGSALVSTRTPGLLQQPGDVLQCGLLGRLCRPGPRACYSSQATCFNVAYWADCVDQDPGLATAARRRASMWPTGQTVSTRTPGLLQQPGDVLQCGLLGRLCRPGPRACYSSQATCFIQTVYSKVPWPVSALGVLCAAP